MVSNRCRNSFVSPVVLATMRARRSRSPSQRVVITRSAANLQGGIAVRVRCVVSPDRHEHVRCHRGDRCRATVLGRAGGNPRRAHSRDCDGVPPPSPSCSVPRHYLDEHQCPSTRACVAFLPPVQLRILVAVKSSLESLLCGCRWPGHADLQRAREACGSRRPRMCALSRIVAAKLLETPDSVMQGIEQAFPPLFDRCMCVVGERELHSSPIPASTLEASNANSQCCDHLLDSSSSSYFKALEAFL